MKIKLSQEQKINLLQTVFIAFIILANLVGAKVINLGPIDVSVAVWLMPVLFLITDILTEIKGPQFVRQLIWSTSFVLIISLVVIQIMVHLQPAERFINNESYVTTFQNSSRMILASVIAFVISQIHDVWAFDFWKRKTHGKHLWLRNNLSTIVSQFIDTVIFMFLAFYYLTPKFDFVYIWQLILPYYLLKLILALGDTPFAYLGVRWLRKK
ncbi:MAG: transporter [Candidatus Komeilibacteria bacterium CG11_big_fil_rev_8_21_14_0_20_36_20]|uniref:Probable queuosine precursor transporter n=1 Tax=Candidatus Komeilibacteria bacterium CG11_big_fil_rev_8_21_14_0_20_36_20 TaxID=1974477 RepID=A0A2H0NE40_9BACT|nr:MAG: transporter [Candidatus Komeilibacteria bacterium CG11_big_fil_rev_8_21_14_0_20_36_20]PIR81266.1 MAG: transporter [Candidatus Komeilibacteria bacterium CG10_big_fil_rev_8_21_14_0_10_36_65]PJC55230.1 MAG: transporter [Candidatus Komeilibacteria bacterium CG_4_9_14_0_2_um_filter_36_13]